MNEKKPLDIAAYIVKLSQDTGEPVTNMKLQKLVYYTYAWYAAEKGEPLFKEPIEAWKYGPVVTSVYEAYKGFGADVIKEPRDGNPDNLDKFTKALIDDVFKVYGGKSAVELVELAHSEAPWRDTFNPAHQDTPIPFESIMSFYKARKEAVA
ncbi:MAG: DUF4065 domain-containing protein [Candidatus Woesebacteria bacterium]|nr:DUF4065 domain-containing protein [Candidatus Woesebacteria bacterium]